MTNVLQHHSTSLVSSNETAKKGVIEVVRLALVVALFRSRLIGISVDTSTIQTATAGIFSSLFRDITSSWATPASFHNPTSLFFINDPKIRCYIIRIIDGANKWTTTERVNCPWMLAIPFLMKVLLKSKHASLCRDVMRQAHCRYGLVTSVGCRSWCNW